MDQKDTSCKEKDQGNDQPFSLIEHVMDHFTIKYGIKKIIVKTSLKVTDQLIDAIIIFVFLTILFYESHVLQIEVSVATVTLGFIFVFILIEFVAANFPTISRHFVSEEKAEYFIKNLGSYDWPKIERTLELLTFSPKNINSLFTYFQTQKDNTHFYIIDDILLWNPLSNENLDRFFSSDILSLNPRRELLIDLFLKYRNKLSTKNIENIYNAYQDDEQLIKVLVATQIDSQSLSKKFLKINEYYTKFHQNEKNKLEIGNLTKRSQTKVIPYRLVFFFLFSVMIFIGVMGITIYFRMFNSVTESAIILLSFFFSTGIGVLPGKYIADKLVYAWRDNAKIKILNLLSSK